MELQRMYVAILKEQGKDTADIEEAMAPPLGAFGHRSAQKRRILQVDRAASRRGSKRQRTPVQAPRLP